MTFIWADLITRARVYLDDDHKSETHFIADDRLMTLLQVEYAKLYRQWVRGGFIGPATTDQTFTGQTVTVPNVLAIIGVAENLTYQKRVLQPAQSRFGRAPFWDGTLAVGKSSRWEASGVADTLLITLHPADAAGSYVVRFISRPAYATDTSTTIDLPYGGDERLVLGAVRRANVKGSTRSAAVEALIMEADAEINFTQFGRIAGDSPRIRRNRQNPFARFPADRFGETAYPANPSDWYWC